MNLDFIKKLLIGIAESAAKAKLVELIEKAEVNHPVEVKAFVEATAALIPVLKNLADDTANKIDDELVEFLTELLEELEPPAQTQDETDPPTSPPPGGPGKP